VGVIAIDGPAAAGKSSVARRVAAEIGWTHLSSGMLYRAVTWWLLKHGAGADPGQMELHLNLGPGGLELTVDGVRPGPELSSPEVVAAVAETATSPAVRDLVGRHLREAGRKFNLVCDGRDIGTTVFPDAVLKVFLTADPRERARRRLIQADTLGGGAGPVERDQALRAQAAELEARDRRDSLRAISPLTRAEDAVEIDNSGLNLDESVAAVLEKIEDRFLGA